MEKFIEKQIRLPLTDAVIADLQAGDYVYITGVLYTARDAAHKRMHEARLRNEPLPFDIGNQCIYYLGPAPAKENQVIGSAGPTTSSRMDAYTPGLLEIGLKGMIGKGDRSSSVIDAIKKNKAVYFAAAGGAGALLSKCITSCEVIAYDDLGTEAVRKIYVDHFPAVVAIDSRGRDVYLDAQKAFA